MRDKASGFRVAEASLPTPSPPVIRAMANTICDHDIDVLRDYDEERIITVLIKAGWTAKDITIHIEQAILMAGMRQRNNELKNA